jgi:hypothetical protein
VGMIHFTFSISLMLHLARFSICRKPDVTPPIIALRKPGLASQNCIEVEVVESRKVRKPGTRSIVVQKTTRCIHFMNYVVVLDHDRVFGGFGVCLSALLFRDAFTYSHSRPMKARAFTYRVIIV